MAATVSCRRGTMMGVDAASTYGRPRLLAALVVCCLLVAAFRPGVVEARPTSSTPERNAILHELRIRAASGSRKGNSDVTADVALPLPAQAGLLRATDLEADRRRRRRDVTAGTLTTVEPHSGTRNKGYGSNSYWNRGGWGGGYGK